MWMKSEDYKSQFFNEHYENVFKYTIIIQVFKISDRDSKAEISEMVLSKGKYEIGAIYIKVFLSMSRCSTHNLCSEMT